MHQTTKRHTHTPNLVKQIVRDVCGSDVVWTLYGDEETSTRESPLENRVYNTTSLPRRRDYGRLGVHAALHAEVARATSAAIPL